MPPTAGGTNSENYALLMKIVFRVPPDLAGFIYTTKQKKPKLTPKKFTTRIPGVQGTSLLPKALVFSACRDDRPPAAPPGDGIFD